MRFRSSIFYSATLVMALLFATPTRVEAGQSRRSLEVPAPGVVRGDLFAATNPTLSPDQLRQLSRQPRPCFVFVHDVAMASTETYDQRQYFVALTAMLDGVLAKWRFDKLSGCGTVMFQMVTAEKTFYGDLAEIALAALQSVDYRSFDASPLKDLYRQIRFVGHGLDSPIYAALNAFLDTGYYGDAARQYKSERQSTPAN